MAPRHLIIGGGTAGMNAIRTIREEETERSAITLVSAEKPYSRMVRMAFIPAVPPPMIRCRAAISVPRPEPARCARPRSRRASPRS